MAAKSQSAYHFFWPNLCLFVLAGIWSPYYYDPDTSRRKKAYEWYHLLLFTICILYLIQSIVEFVRLYPELTIDDKSEFYSYIVQLLVGLLKKYFLQRNEARTRKMFQDIELPPFQRNNDLVFKLKLRARKKTVLKIMALFWIPIYTTVLLKLITVGIQTKANKDYFNEVCKDTLISVGNESLSFAKELRVDCSSFPKMERAWITWFPFKTDQSPGNQLSIGYSLIVLTIFAPYIFNFDMYITSWMMYITFQFEMMIHDLETLREKSIERVQANSNGPVDEGLLAEEMVRGIRLIIRLHGDILR